MRRESFRQMLWALLASTLLLAGPARADDWIYYAEDGDTLWDLCLEYTNKRGCWIELGRINNISNGRRMPIGREIRIPRGWLVNPPRVGTVLSVEGATLVQRSGGSTTLGAGDPLLLGDRLVSEGGAARLQLGSRGEVLLRPYTTLELNNLSTQPQFQSDMELSLERGAVEVDVRPAEDSRFRIQTPAAIAAVRGTRYRLVVSEEDGVPSTRGEVLSGAVEVAAVDTVVLEAGYGITAKKGQKLAQARKLLPGPRFVGLPASAFGPVTLNWAADPGAAAWNLDVLRDNSGRDLFTSRRLVEPTATLELPVGCYQLVLRAIDADGFNGLESRAPLCVTEPPPPEPPAPEPENTFWPTVLVVAAMVLVWL